MIAGIPQLTKSPFVIGLGDKVVHELLWNVLSSPRMFPGIGAWQMRGTAYQCPQYAIAQREIPLNTLQQGGET